MSSSALQYAMFSSKVRPELTDYLAHYCVVRMCGFLNCGNLSELFFYSEWSTNCRLHMDKDGQNELLSNSFSN